MLPSLLIITKNYPPIVCGVGDHSYVLKQQLAQRGWQVSILTWQQQQWGLLQTEQHSFTPLHENPGKAIVAAGNILGQKPVLFWQYAPLSFSKNGIPIQLAFQMANLGWKGYQQSIFFHEVAVRTWGYGVAQMLHSAVQKTIANTLNCFVKHTATSIALYRSYFIIKQPVLIPVGSNFSVAPGSPPLIPVDAIHFFCFTNRCTAALLQALAQFAATVSRPIQLHVAGAANTTVVQQLEQYIQNAGAGQWVHLHGVLSNEALAGLIKTCSILLQPQPLEPNGQGGVSAKNGTMAAAMQAGKAIITIEGDMTETQYFEHGKTCWLLPKDETSLWLEAISLLATDEALQVNLGAGAQHCYETYFSAAITVPAIEKLLKA